MNIKLCLKYGYKITMTKKLSITYFIVLTMLLSAFVNVGSLRAAEDNNAKIYHMQPYKISQYIKSTKGQKRAIIIYASWCPYCIKKMPGIMDLERVKPGSIIAISVDEEHRDFIKYTKRFESIPFKVILNNGSEYKLVQSLKRYGVKAWDGIPYIILMDENNKVTGQANYSVEQVADYIFSK